MEIPISHRARAPPSLPEIYVQDSDRFRMSGRSNSYNSPASHASIPGAMSIPNAKEYVPPPLPPPRHIEDIAENGGNGPDLAWKWGNYHVESSMGSAPSLAPGSSLYGSFASGQSSFGGRPEPVRQNSSSSTIKSIRSRRSPSSDKPYARMIDEGYHSVSGTSIVSNKPQYEEHGTSRYGFQSSVHDTYRSNAQAFDKFQLQKLDARRGSDNTTPPRGFSKSSSFSSSVNDASPTSRIAHLENQQSSQLKPLSLPILSGRHQLVESPVSKWAEPRSSSVMSPGNPYPRYGYRSPSDTADSDRPYTRRSGSGSIASLCDDTSSITSRSRDTNDQRASPDRDIDFQMEETALRHLHLDEFAARQDGYLPGVAAGQKRRASSPPVDDSPSLHSVGSASDLFRRRESGSRTSPGPRYHSNSGSISSTASGPRSTSYTATTMSMSSSGMPAVNTSNGFGRLSPGGLSSVPTDGSESSFQSSSSLNPSLRGSASKSNHNRTPSDSRPIMSSRTMPESNSRIKTSSSPKLQGAHICGCCPKKPKKYDTKEELSIHEQEKQYECHYCPNRFKNKNEAERHQNSLHLRRHSWSCAALSGYHAAFHVSPIRPNEADSCGYCGEDFPRSGLSSPSPNGNPIAVATDQDWESRVVHLQEMHKFGECNQAKKFFRADHFRQHLKHSHAGTSGKWTNMLENACMKDEPLPEPIRGPGRISPGDNRVPRINEEEEIQ